MNRQKGNKSFREEDKIQKSFQKEVMQKNKSTFYHFKLFLRRVNQ